MLFDVVPPEVLLLTACVTGSGPGPGLWHTIRNADGTWAPNFGLIESQEHNNPGTFNAISCAGVGNQLQVVGIV